MVGPRGGGGRACSMSTWPKACAAIGCATATTWIACVWIDEMTDPAMQTPRELEHDWDKDFDLAAWQSLSAAERVRWLDGAYGREADDASLQLIYWQRADRYRRFQTAWDIGLEPQPFDETLAEAVGEVKPE